MQPAGAASGVNESKAVCKGDQRERRWPRKTKPVRDSTSQPGAGESDRRTHHAAGRTRQRLAQGDQIGIALLMDPLPTVHVLLVEVAKVSDWAAERGQAQPRGDPQNLQD